MIPRDHDYTGKERDQHKMNITTWYDGELIWIELDGTHSWNDGCYTHRWVHAMPIQSLLDIVKNALESYNRYIYITEVHPQVPIEIGEEWEQTHGMFDNAGGWLNV